MRHPSSCAPASTTASPASPTAPIPRSSTSRSPSCAITRRPRPLSISPTAGRARRSRRSTPSPTAPCAKPSPDSLRLSPTAPVRPSRSLSLSKASASSPSTSSGISPMRGALPERTTMTKLRLAIVGAGPAGIYAADILLKAERRFDVSIDLFEQLPAPYGLVRYGVAPDHPRIKGIITALREVLDSGDIRIFGNVRFGEDITLEDLKRH